jgi:hypothetical protein
LRSFASHFVDRFHLEVERTDPVIAAIGYHFEATSPSLLEKGAPANLLMRDKRRIAANIAKLPEAAALTRYHASASNW